MNNSTAEIELVKGVRAVITGIHKIKKAGSAWRIDINYISDIPSANKLIKNYYIWVTNDFLIEKKLTVSQDSLQQVGLEIAERQFERSGKETPIEDGISILTEGNEVIVDPKSYMHPEETV